MPPSHHHTNDAATHLLLAFYITQVNLHYLNGPNNMFRVWANGYFLFYFILFIFVTEAATSLLHQ